MNTVLPKSLAVLLFALVFSLASTGRSNATSVSVAFNNGATQVTTELSAFGTMGSAMAGMSLTATFADSSTETVTWQSLGILSGGVTGTGWGLSQIGDTFDSAWTLNSTGALISGLSIDAGTGNSVFDTFFGALGTTGSFQGKDFNVVSGLSTYDILATYRDAVALTGASPVGDLYRSLDINFTGSAFGSSGTILQFIADTDSLKFTGDLDPVGVPEPSTLLLLGSGILGLGGLGYVRRKLRL